MSGFIYAIAAGDAVKIGWSKNPLQRLIKLKTDNAASCDLLGAKPGTRREESDLHTQFSQWNIRQEWFLREGAVADFIASLPVVAPVARPISRGLNPAKTVIEKFGGVEAVSAITGRHITRVYRWMHPRENGGTDGLIPAKEARKLLAAASDRGIDLTPAEIFGLAPTEPVG